jgi:hypothetical protein
VSKWMHQGPWRVSGLLGGMGSWGPGGVGGGSNLTPKALRKSADCRLTGRKASAPKTRRHCLPPCAAHKPLNLVGRAHAHRGRGGTAGCRGRGGEGGLREHAPAPPAYRPPAPAPAAPLPSGGHPPETSPDSAVTTRAAAAMSAMSAVAAAAAAAASYTPFDEARNAHGQAATPAQAEVGAAPSPARG